MSDTLALFIPATPELPWRWMIVRDGAIASRGEEYRAPTSRPTHASLRSPGRRGRAALGGTAGSQRRPSDHRGAPAGRGASVSPLGDLHVAIGRRSRGRGEADRCGDGGADERLAGDAGEHGICARSSPSRANAAAAPDDGYVIGDLGDGRIVRGTSSGFADEDGLTALIVGDAPVVVLDRAALEAAVVAAIADPPLDLRQGPFALQRRAAIDWLLARRLAWLAAATMAVTLAITLVSTIRYNLSASSLEAQADALARQGLPPGASVDDAAQQLTERLARLRGPGAGFSQTAASVATAVAAVPGAEITGLAFDAGGRLRINLTVQSQPQIAEVQNRLAAAGFARRAARSRVARGGSPAC